MANGHYSKIREDFNSEAENPKGMFSKRMTEADGAIVRYLQPIIKKEWKVLDVGAGMGNVIEWLICDKYAIDISEKMLYNCNIEKKFVGNMDSMPFEDKMFDLVYASFTLQQSEDPEKTLKEIERVAKRVIIFEGNSESSIGIEREKQMEAGTWETCGKAQWFSKSFFNKLGYETDNLLPHVLIATKYE